MKTLLSKGHFSFLAVIFFCLLYMPGVDAAEGEPAIEVSPEKIEITMFYHGTDIEVRGTAPSASEVALVVVGKQEEQTLSRKGRVGPLWMNVETVTVKGAPQMYCILTSTNTLEELAASEILTEYEIGYDTLGKSVSIEQESPDLDATFREFIKLKESMGLYKVLNDSIGLKPQNGNFSEFSVSLAIPPRVPPGEYSISMYCFKEGQTVSNSSSILTVEKAGLPAKLSFLAFNHAAVYGVLSIVIAVAVGLFMGVLFGKKGGGGH